MSMRNTVGWRWADEDPCLSVHSGGRWRCARAKGHRDWHSCDNASWPQEVSAIASAITVPDDVLAPGLQDIAGLARILRLGKPALGFDHLLLRRTTP